MSFNGLKKHGIVLEPKGEIGAIFNPGATEHNGDIVLLPRVVMKGFTPKEKGYGFDNYISKIWYAKSDDGKDFTLSDEPVIKPDKPYDIKGCEDPRITKLNGEYFITYTALSNPAFSGRGGRIGLVSTKDFFNFEKHGIIGPDVSGKNAVIFSDKINGKIGVLYRMDPITSPIRIMYFDDIKQLKKNHGSEPWEKYMGDLDKHIVLDRKYEWESSKIGAGPSPIKTDEGWLLLYHGVDKNKIYRAGAALLDLDNPQKIIARSSEPISGPEEGYDFDIPNVKFPEGVVVRGEEFYIYSGINDKFCWLDTCNLKELVNFLIKQHSI